MGSAGRTGSFATLTRRPEAARVAAVRARSWRALWDGGRFHGHLLVFGLASMGWSLLAALLCRLLPTSAGQWLGRRAIVAGFRLFLRGMCASGALVCDLSALDALRGAGKLVIVPNHPSQLDAVLLLSRLPDAVCLMKASIWDNPCLGGGARLAGYLRNDGTALGVVRAGVAALRDGRQLLIFPEGTRSDTLPAGKLKAGFALMAQQAGAGVQAVLIESDGPYLRKGWPVWRRPALPIVVRVRLGRRFDPPFEPASLTRELARHYAEEIGGATPRAGAEAG